MSDVLLNHILEQIDLAKSELSSYPPDEINWISRTKKTANLIVPWLHSNRTELKSYVEKVMNSPCDARTAADKISAATNNSDSNKTLLRLVRKLQKSLEFESLLIAQTGGTVVSKLIENFLIEKSVDWKLESNGASDYPDLFFRNFDYANLPEFKRDANIVYGAAVKGKRRRPVRIPDGLEIKTCKGRFAVDCHHAHAGFHLVLLFTKTLKRFDVNDIQIGFLRHELYRITKPASPTTTLKASFNGDHFVSLWDPDTA